MNLSIPISDNELKLIIDVCKEEVERCREARNLFKMAADEHEASLRRQRQSNKLLNRLVKHAIKTGNEFNPMAIRPELN